ncbi:MAG: ABC transporter permease [Acetobacteraceae bacterium]|nr:ABC transporter permease [Acetobacteraceae bacterium]
MAAGMRQEVLARAGSLLLLLLFWETAAWLVGSPRLLPGIGAVLGELLQEIRSGELAHHLGITLLRVACAFALAMLAGVALGTALGRSPRLDRWLDAWVLLLLNVPALVVAALLYIWLGLTEAAAILAVALNKLPTVVVTLREGARALDPAYAELARAYHLSHARMLRHVVVPQLAPYTLAAARTGLSLIWKIVLVVELIGRSDGIGFRIGLFFQLFDIAGILAYTLAFAAVVQLIEWTVLQPLERRVNRWR